MIESRRFKSTVEPKKQKTKRFVDVEYFDRKRCPGIWRQARRGVTVARDLAPFTDYSILPFTLPRV